MSSSCYSYWSLNRPYRYFWTGTRRSIYVSHVEAAGEVNNDPRLVLLRQSPKKSSTFCHVPTYIMGQVPKASLDVYINYRKEKSFQLGVQSL